MDMQNRDANVNDQGENVTDDNRRDVNVGRDANVVGRDVNVAGQPSLNPAVDAQSRGVYRGTHDASGRPLVLDADGNYVAQGSGKCPTCGRDMVNTGDGFDNRGRPLVKDASGKHYAARAHGATVDAPRQPVVNPAVNPTRPVVKPAPVNVKPVV